MAEKCLSPNSAHKWRHLLWICIAPVITISFFIQEQQWYIQYMKNTSRFDCRKTDGDKTKCLSKITQKCCNLNVQLKVITFCVEKCNLLWHASCFFLFFFNGCQPHRLSANWKHFLHSAVQFITVEFSLAYFECQLFEFQQSSSHVFWVCWHHKCMQD